MQLDIRAYELALLQERMERKLNLSNRVIITFDPAKHPRDLQGRFRKVLAKLSEGDVAELPDGVRVTKRKGKFQVSGGADHPYAKGTEAKGAQGAAKLALLRSAANTDERSVGGTKPLLGPSAHKTDADLQDEAQAGSAGGGEAGQKLSFPPDEAFRQELLDMEVGGKLLRPGGVRIARIGDDEYTLSQSGIHIFTGNRRDMVLHQVPSARKGKPASELVKGDRVKLGGHIFEVRGQSGLPKSAAYGNAEGNKIDVHLLDPKTHGRTSTRVARDHVLVQPDVDLPEESDWASQATEKLAPYVGEIKRSDEHNLRIFPKQEIVEALAKHQDPDWPFNYEHEKWEHSYEISGGWDHGRYYAGGPHIPMPSEYDSIRFDTLDEAIEAVKAGLIDQRATVNPGPSTKWIHERGKAAKAHNERLHRGGY